MPPYADTDFVYYDPRTKTVIGPVQWTRDGNVLPLERPDADRDPEERPQRRGKRRSKEYYIWGSYRSLKRLYNIEGKVRDAERTQTLDQAMERAQSEAYWD